MECWLGSFVVLRGIRTSIAKKPFIFVIFQGGPDLPVPPSGSAHACPGSELSTDLKTYLLMRW